MEAGQLKGQAEPVRTLDAGRGQILGLVCRCKLMIFANRLAMGEKESGIMPRVWAEQLIQQGVCEQSGFNLSLSSWQSLSAPRLLVAGELVQASPA